MKNTNKMIEKISEMKETFKNYSPEQKLASIGLFIIITAVIYIVFLYEDPKITDAKKELLQKTKIEILVEKQSENLKIIWKNLEDQKVLRSEIEDLEEKLSWKVDQVKKLEQENVDFRKQMLDDANNIQEEKTDPIVSNMEIVEKKKINNFIPEVKANENPKVIKKEWQIDDPRQDLINYAYNKGWKDFVLTLEGENGLWTPDRRSMILWKNGHYDYWLCQLNTQWHAPFVNSPEFKDAYKQIDYCFGVWQDAFKKGRIKTTFYAYNVRNRYVVRFENLK